MGLHSYGQGYNFKNLLALNQESALEDLAVAIECIINSGRTHFRLRHLKKELGPNDPRLPPLSSNFFDYPLNTLVEKGLVREERRSEPQYSVRSLRKLIVLYEGLKEKLPTKFVQEVLGEGV